MNIGSLNIANTDNQPLALKGTIELPNINGIIYLVPNPSRYNDKSPDMIVKMADNNGVFVKVGSAWRKELKNDAGDFYSITLDNPSLEKPVYISAFPEFDDEKNGGKILHYNLTWSRPRANTMQSMNMAGQQQPIDQIPY